MRTALALFTVFPVRHRAEFARDRAVRALLWFPVIGALLGALAALPLAATRAWTPHAGLLGAVLAVALLAMLSRGLHLDGLADTADGLGSRAPAERALEIMRRSDIGPFGVVAIVLVLLVDLAALAAIGGTWRPVAALAAAAATGRLAAVHAAHRRVPAARGDGFGAYVAASVGTPLLVAETAGVLGSGVGLAAATGAGLVGWPASQAGALFVSAVILWHLRRRLGGTTGDVFGALVEISTALTLIGLAVA